MFDKCRICFATLVLMLATVPAYAQVTIYAYDIPGLYQEDGGGVYDTIVEQLVSSAGMGQLKILPGIRAEKEFARCQNCCISPANTNPAFYDFDDDVIATDPMNVAEIYIFSRRNNPPIVDIDALQGKRVGVRRGMMTSLQSVLDRGDFRLQPVNSIEQNVDKLDKGRIDAFIDFVPDVYLAASALGIDPHPHTKGTPLERHPDSLVCRAVSDQFLTTFNDGLQAMKDSGKLAEILGDSMVDHE